MEEGCISEEPPFKREGSRDGGVEALLAVISARPRPGSDQRAEVSGAAGGFPAALSTTAIIITYSGVTALGCTFFFFGEGLLYNTTTFYCAVGDQSWLGLTCGLNVVQLMASIFHPPMLLDASR